jgi:glycosyl transferase, family 25
VDHMQVFVINLQRRPDRMAAMAARLKALGLAYERVEAFDARNEPLAGKLAWVRAYIYNHLRAPPPGHIGVYTSHRQVWQMMIDRNLPQAMVLEDDVVPHNWDAGILTQDIAALGLDQLRIERIDVPGWEKLNPLPKQSYAGTLLLGRRLSTENTWGAAAYIVTLAGARKMLAAGPFWFFIDHYRMWAIFHDLKTAILMPPMWQQADETSDIADVRNSATLHETLVDKIRKIPRKALLAAMLVKRRIVR